MTVQRISRTAFGLALLLIIWGSLTADLGVEIDMRRYDKLFHLTGYFALALLAALGWPRWRGVALVSLPLVGLALEVAQDATGRSFEWEDALTNAAGIGAAVALSALFTRWMERR